MALPDDAIMVLAFERTWGQRPRWERNRAIRRIFGFSELRYAQRLTVVLEAPEALLLEPALVSRLRRLRDQRRRARTARRIA